MKPDKENEDIRTLFQTAHKQYEALVPSFRDTLAASKRRQLPFTGRKALLIAASFTVITVIFVRSIIDHQKPHPETITAEFSRSTHWRGPTDFLLKTPGLELIETMPAIPSAMPNYGNLEKNPISPPGDVR